MRGLFFALVAGLAACDAPELEYSNLYNPLCALLCWAESPRAGESPPTEEPTQ